VANKWSAGVQPNVLQQTLQVNSGAAAESVGGEGGGVKRTRRRMRRNVMATGMRLWMFSTTQISSEEYRLRVNLMKLPGLRDMAPLWLNSAVKHIAEKEEGQGGGKEGRRRRRRRRKNLRRRRR